MSCSWMCGIEGGAKRLWKDNAFFFFFFFPCLAKEVSASTRFEMIVSLA